MHKFNQSMDFYLDESGNTGGVSQQSFESSFGGQRLFTLAAIGVAEEEELREKILPLITRHRINSKELKSSTLFKKKPQFFVDVFSLVKNESWPIFIEAVDKKFMLTANIVNSIVFPGYCFESETRETSFIRNTFAEYLYINLPDTYYADFLGLCSNPSINGLVKLIDDFIEELKGNKNDISDALIHSLTMTRDDVNGRIENRDQDIESFIPIPDAGKRGKQVWMLPNLSSFTNIYARINLYMNGNLSNIKIFHDEQLQYDTIIEKAKHDVEHLPFAKFGFVSDSTDYKFKKTADLFFKISHASIGIQVADLLAGFVMRFISERLKERTLDSTILEAHKLLMTMNREEAGIGLNMVMSTQDARIINKTF